MRYDNFDGAVGVILGEMVNRYGNLTEVVIIFADDPNGHRRYYVEGMEVYFDEASQIWRFLDDYNDNGGDLDEEY